MTFGSRASFHRYSSDERILLSGVLARIRGFLKHYITAGKLSSKSFYPIKVNQDHIAWLQNSSFELHVTRDMSFIRFKILTPTHVLFLMMLVFLFL